MKQKIPYNAIISLVGAIILILQCFGVKLDVAYVNEIAVAVAGVLVALGIVLPKKEKPMDNTVPQDEKTEE